MTALPTGTVTLLFTDVEGSTRLLRELGEEYSALLAEHRRLLRDAVGRHGGVEVDTQGDAFFFVFPTAPGAVAAAADAQEALANGRLRVRMGAHTGAPRLTGEGYVGEDIHLAARIAAAAHGGQVLLSAQTQALVTAEVTGLGQHRVKDFDQLLELFQLGRQSFPPLRTLSNTNLPRPLSSFVGRVDVLEQIRALLRGSDRLLTLTGPGGSGKTRLAIEAASALVGDFEGGVHWVGLAPVRDERAVLETIGQTLGAKTTVAEHVGDRAVLLLLDNLEHVIGAAPEIGTLLADCPNLRILATSRERLHIGGEFDLPVLPLPSAEGMELYCARARVAPAADVERLCRALENLPLALELAAASAAAISPNELLGRLSGRLDLLSGGRDADPRQQTLRATIEWSYDLLQPDEQCLFDRLAVFSGGCTLAAAETVCEAQLRTIAALVDKSLLRRSGERYWMLETIREYALERLEARGELGALRRRHAHHFLEFAERAEPELTGADQSLWIGRIANDHENLRGALEVLLAEEGHEPVLRLAGSLVLFWYLRGFYREGVEWLRKGLDDDPPESPALAKALWGTAFLTLLAGELESTVDAAERGLALATRLEDRSTSARVKTVLGVLSFFQGDGPSAASLLEEAAADARVAGDTWCLADTLGTLSSIYPLYGRIEEAKPVAREGLQLARRHHDQHGIRMALFGLGLALVRSPGPEDAREVCAEGLAICREIGDPWFTSYFLWLLATESVERGDLERARDESDEALAVAREIEADLLSVCALDIGGRVHLASGRLAEAEAGLRDALSLSERGAVPPAYAASARLALADVLAAAGRDAESAAERARAAELAEASGDVWLAARAR